METEVQQSVDSNSGENDVIYTDGSVLHSGSSSNWGNNGYISNCGGSGQDCISRGAHGEVSRPTAVGCQGGHQQNIGRGGYKRDNKESHGLFQEASSHYRDFLFENNEGFQEVTLKRTLKTSRRLLRMSRSRLKQMVERNKSTQNQMLPLTAQ